MKIFRQLLLGALLIGIGVSAAQAASAPAHKLQAPHLRLLKALQVPIAVPGYLPKDCSLMRVLATQDTPGPGSGPGYEIDYVCPDTGNFTVRGATGGFGGPSGDKIESVWNPVYGKITINLFLVDGNLKIEEPYFYSDWVGKGPLYYSIISGGEGLDQMKLPEAKKVLQSLKPL